MTWSKTQHLLFLLPAIFSPLAYPQAGLPWDHCCYSRHHIKTGKCPLKEGRSYSFFCLSLYQKQNKTKQNLSQEPSRRLLLTSHWPEFCHMHLSKSPTLKWKERDHCGRLAPLTPCGCLEDGGCLNKVRVLLEERGTSLVAQWLRIHLPMQQTRVRSLVWEDPTCCRAT